MEFRLPHRKHASVDDVIAEAQKGNAFFVHRAVLNGDLAHLPQNEQRRIVAMVNDEAARYATDQIIPTTYEGQISNNNFINKHINLALRVFTKAQKRSIKDEIEDMYNS
jgi:hypothetical protein